MDSNRMERFFAFNDTNMVISDYKWWVENEYMLLKWLKHNTENGLKCRKGMTITFKNKDELLWFTLRWQ